MEAVQFDRPLENDPIQVSRLSGAHRASIGSADLNPAAAFH
jgi:hypothetical protein